jgi:tRNA threonylcarbamoyladenosine biosynthesis protein TsaB
MKILALETSAIVASVAIIDDGKVLAEYTINNKLTHSINLMPMLERMVEKVEFDLKTLDYIAIANGPGSFTGLRIGSATAKGLAHGLDIPIVEVPTLYAMAMNLRVYDGYVIPMIDARRQQVFTSVYRSGRNNMDMVIKEQVCSIEELVKQIKELDQQLPCILLGDGVEPNIEFIDKYFYDMDYQQAPIHLMFQNASSVAVSALEYIARGETVTCFEHGPKYLRMTQAEREYKEKHGGNI